MVSNVAAGLWILARLMWPTTQHSQDLHTYQKMPKRFPGHKSGALDIQANPTLVTSLGKFWLQNFLYLSIPGEFQAMERSEESQRVYIISLLDGTAV